MINEASVEINLLLPNSYTNYLKTMNDIYVHFSVFTMVLIYQKNHTFKDIVLNHTLF